MATEPEGQLARWLERLQEYDFKICHQMGTHHQNADALSRHPSHQAEEPEVAGVYSSTDKSDTQHGLGIFWSLQGYQTAQHLPHHCPHTVLKFALLDMDRLTEHYSLFIDPCVHDGLAFFPVTLL